MLSHIGMRIRDKQSNHITKEFYLTAKPEHMSGWKEEHYQLQVKRASLNYDINMRYLESLDRGQFQEYLSKKCKKYRLKECLDLNELDCVEGLYMMVLDEYKQVYIGVSNNIKRRILAHWNNFKSLERLIWGDICTSTLSIDSFGALDTTRIYYFVTSNPLDIEYKMLEDFDLRYTLNRTAGGIGRDTDMLELFGKSHLNLEIVAHRREIAMASFCDVKQLREIVPKQDFEWYLQRYPELKEQMDSH